MNGTQTGTSTRFDGIFLRGVALLKEAIPGVGDRTLLHAGPPFVGCPIPVPVRTAAIHALLFEGLAKTSGEAADLIDSGRIDLQPAQDWGVVTPLAQVVSPSMPVFIIGNGKRQTFAPLIEGAPPALRFGSPEPECLDKLRLHADFAYRELAPQLREVPVAIATLIERALAEGNDCHTLTDRANLALMDQLQGLSCDYRSLLDQSPGFVLPILMGACAWLLRFGQDASKNRRVIAAAGGNGNDFGIRLIGQSQWITVPAQAPTGHRFAPQEHRPALGAIGDSAVIDFCGLGGQALLWAPALVADWKDLLPDDWRVRPDSILDPDSGVVCPSRVMRQQMPPIVNLALVAADHKGGILGKGFYQPDLSLFCEPQARVSS